MTKGSIVAIRDHGTIVELVLDNGDPVYFDHRMFSHLWEAEEGNLVGRSIEVRGDFGEQTLEFTEGQDD